MAPKRDLQAARLRRAGVPVDEESLKADSEHAHRLAKLAATASARGAAPLPPGKGGAAPPKPAAPSAPAKVTKYRAIEGFKSDELEFEKGATIFVVGEPADGMVQGVALGKAGKIPTAAITPITPELLEQERIQAEKDIEAARIEEEENLRKEMEQMKLDHAAKSASSGGDGSAPAPKSEADLAYEKELEEKFEQERQSLLDEENRLKAEAARIEAMLAALDDDED
eukprot:m.353304 g.353304  ORF g.353304 m.353304 type:complete len:226 (-) comp16733_c0_seq1:584-1261(-)